MKTSYDVTAAGYKPRTNVTFLFISGADEIITLCLVTGVTASIDWKDMSGVFMALSHATFVLATSVVEFQGSTDSVFT